VTRALANLVLLFSAFVWGTAFVAQATAMEEIGPFLFTGLRFVLAVPAILPFALREARAARLSGQPARGRWPVGWLVGLNGLVFFCGGALQQIGIQYTSVTNAGFLTGVYVVMVPFVAWAMFRSAPNRIVWLAALVSVAGVFLLSGGGLTPFGIGDVLMLVGSVFWAVQVALLGLLVVRTGRPIGTAFVQFAIAGMLGLVLALILEPIEIRGIVAALPEIFYAGLLSGGLAYTLQAIAQRWSPPAEAAVILSSEAVFAAIAGLVVMGDRLSLPGYGGAALILGAILLVQLWPNARNAR